MRRDDARPARHPDPAAPGGIRTLAPWGEVLAVREWSGGSRRWAEQSEVQPGEVLVYVVRGALEVELGGDVHALGEGDALLFDGTLPHRMRRTGAVSTRALLVAAPADGI